MENTTIAAIATPPGYGGIGIVKISGPKAIQTATALFQKKGGSFNASGNHWIPESRRLYYGHIVDPEENRRIDEVMFVAMRSPSSYTGEDVVEIQAHAGPLVLKSILNLLLKQGVHLAGPGEFTKRAFLNGRMDLSQAEAVIDLINAGSGAGIELAVRQLDGGLKREVDTIRNELLNILAELEAGIDFPEDVEASDAPAPIAARLERYVLAPIRKLIQEHDDRNWLREGLRVAIAGSPNVGKSSLLNQLLDRERAIVTEYPGTTRDLVEDGFIISGVPVIVTDTAGIREHPDPIERHGINKAFANIEAADVILLVLDASQPIGYAHFSFMERFQNKTIVLVLNKTDLPERAVIPDDWQYLQTVRVSAKYNQGIDRLKSMLASYAGDNEPSRGLEIVPNLRQKQALEKSLASVEAARDSLSADQPAELVAIDLNDAVTAVREITGEIVSPDILDRIFEQFCIGK
ncbi:MAG: tRNA uridine-5-carboxymethylaminomethyl(34) synthesis GTPase MnmE [Desulfobacterales bacterium]|nr:tRNA uridine-5-carboxymethylaminomethyl(34) synthesis GTPase MnmE [Desulfobacterales bacterium]